MAATMVAATLVLTLVPLGAMANTHERFTADGVVVAIYPRAATANDAGVVLSPIGGQYLFDFEIFDGTTANALGPRPLPMRQIMVDINTVDPTTGTAGTTLLYSARIDFSAPTSKGTFGIPAETLAFQDEATHGFAVTLLATYNATMTWLHHSTRGYPGGTFNLAVNELVANRQTVEADRADEGATPVFGVNLQPVGLITPGNPILNPGFEVGSPFSTDAAVPHPTYGFKGSMAPWILRVDDGDHVPHSRHYRAMAAEDSISGSYAKIAYDTLDNPRNLYFGQLFGNADQTGAPSVWKGSSDLQIEYDVRIVDNNSVATTFAGATTIHWGTAANLVIRSPANPIPVDGEWHHVVVDFDDALNARTLNAAFLSLDDAFPAGSEVTVSIDNFVIRGARYGAGNGAGVASAPAKNDLMDGYTALIQPMASNLTRNQEAIARTVTLASGNGYVLRLGAMDYTSGRAEALSLDDANYVVVKLLDETWVQSRKSVGQAGPGDVVYHAESNGPGADKLFRTTSGEWLMVVPGNLVNKVVVPWMFADVETGDTYASTYTVSGVHGQSEPVSGYYSAVRNNLAGWSLADQLDYAFTPVLLSNQPASVSMVSNPTLTLTCPAISPGGSCGDSVNGPVTLRATYASPSEVIEPVTLKLVSRISPSVVLDTAVVNTPGGTVDFALTSAKLSQLRATGDMRVMVTATSGTFTTGVPGPVGTPPVNVFRVDNLAPVADFAMTPNANIDSLTGILLNDKSKDTDGTFTRSWKVWLVEDATDDEKDVDPSNPVAAGTGASLSFFVPDDGLYEVNLTVRDNDGVEVSKVTQFTAGNTLPRAVLSGPSVALGNVTVNFEDRSNDNDGIIVLREIHNGTDWESVTLVGGKFLPVVTSLASGIQTIQLRVTDDDGATATITRTLLVDADAPVTSLSAPVPNGANGWYRNPVVVSVGRTDTGGSGLRSTTFTDNGATALIEGSSAFTRTVGGDGLHVVTARSRDNAGNLEAVAQTLTLKIDASAPSVVASYSGSTVPSTPPEVPASTPATVLAGDKITLTATAADAQSGVTKVVFQIVGGAVIGEDTDGTNGWSALWDTSGRSGPHEVAFIATNGAGATASVTQRFLVVPSAPAPGVAQNGDGSVTVYDDKNKNNQVDAGESIARTPTPPSPPADADGDKIPDDVEVLVCGKESAATVLDGTCVGSNWSPPTPEAIVAEVTGKVPTPPASPDADGDGIPDGAEPAVCEAEDEASAADGACTGNNYTAPSAPSLGASLRDLLP